MSSNPVKDTDIQNPSEPPLWATPTLRVHLQGMFLLIVLLLVFWALLNWAVPVISNALSGTDGAIVARSPIPSEDSDTDGGSLAEGEQPLEGEEIVTLQEALTRFGYEPGPVDGILGELTRAAVDAAKADLGLPSAPDRLLLDTLLAVEDFYGNERSTNS